MVLVLQWLKVSNKIYSNIYLAPTNSSHSGIRLHLCTVSNGPKSNVKHSVLSGQLWSNSIPGGRAMAIGAVFSAQLQEDFRFCMINK